MAEGYLSEDMESRLRQQAPVPCRICRKLLAKHSVVSAQPLLGCGKPETGPNGDILARLLIDVAKRDGQCSFMEPFEELIR